MPWPTDSSEIQRRPSGLEYFPVESGPADGASPTDTDDVAIVNFEGRLEGVKAEEGETAEDDLRARSVVLSTYDEGAPKDFPVKGSRPPAGAEAVKLMRTRRPLDGAHARAAGSTRTKAMAASRPTPP